MNARLAIVLSLLWAGAIHSPGQAQAAENTRLFADTCVKAITDPAEIANLVVGHGFKQLSGVPRQAPGIEDRFAWELRDAGSIRNRIVRWEAEALGQPASLCMLIAWGDWRIELYDFTQYFGVSDDDIPTGYVEEDARFWRTAIKGVDVYLEFRTPKPTDYSASYSMTIGRLRGN